MFVVQEKTTSSKRKGKNTKAHNARRKQTIKNVESCLRIGSSMLLIAVAWTVIRWAWLSYDWFPMVKSSISGFGIPLALSFLTSFLLRHEIKSVNDKYENLMGIFLMLSSVFIYVNAGFIAEDATVQVVRIDKLTDLPRKEIKKANYVQVEQIEPDTSSYGYTSDYYIQTHQRRADNLMLCVYQVCPLKDMQDAFVCSETKAEHSLGLLNKFDEPLQRWMEEFEHDQRGTIKHEAMTARFFKVIHQNDNIEQYMKAATSYYISHGYTAPTKKDVILLERRHPDDVNGYWDNVAIVFGALIFVMAILALFFRLTGGVSQKEYDESKKSYNETKHDILSYMSRRGNFLVLLPPFVIIGWELYMIYNGYNPDGSNDILFVQSGACSPYSLYADGEWWRSLTSIFIHGNFLHFTGNMIGYGFGAWALSYHLSGRDIALVFLISGILSTGFAVLFSQHTVIGASGGVLGLYGAFLSIFTRNSSSKKCHPVQSYTSFFIICMTVFFTIVISFRSNISMSGHLAGLVSGAIVARIFRLVYK